MGQMPYDFSFGNAALAIHMCAAPHQCFTHHTEALEQYSITELAQLGLVILQEFARHWLYIPASG